MGDLGTTRLLYSARPTLRVDGVEEAALATSTLTVLVTESTEGLRSCELTLGNWGSKEGSVGFVYFDRSVLDFGSRLQIELGDSSSSGEVFDGHVTAIEGRYPGSRPPELLVLAEDRLQELRMVRRTRLFEDVTDSDVFEEICSGHGLSAEVDVDGPQHKAIAQLNQSDLAFLRERAQAIDAETWIEADTVHVQSRSRRSSDEIVLTYGQGLRELAISADLAEQRTALTVSGWDVEGKQALSFTADASTIQSESEGQSGSQLLESSFGPRIEHISHELPQTSDEVRTVAQSRFRQMARRFVRGRGVTDGDARIQVGSTVRFEATGELFDGAYTVTEVRHGFDPIDGFRTTFAVERPSIPGGSA